MTIADLGERALIARIRDRAGSPPEWVTIGIGDDAAAIAAPRNLLTIVTTDSLIEGVHFRREWTAPRAIGEKAVTINLSDLAAMGARPRALLLSLALPETFPVEDFDSLIDGVVTTAASARATLIGGNLAASPAPMMITVTALGEAHPRKVLRRSGGVPGDELYLTGTIGAAAAGLAMLTQGVSRKTLQGDAADCVDRYERPVVRLKCGSIVARTRAANACIDLSDGLSAAVTQLAEASGTGAVLEAASLPIHPGAVAWSSSRGQDPVDAAITGGEDYELVFAVPPRRRRAFLAAAKQSHTAVTLVGRLTKEAGCRLQTDAGSRVLASGFQHF